MGKIKGYEIILGAVMIVSVLIGGFEVINYAPGNFIPREKVCIASHVYDGGLSGYWDEIINKTGIDTGTAFLTGLKIENHPDGTIDAINIEFLADKDGAVRQYMLWYRRDPRSCGWSDGLSYPEKPGVTHPPLPVHPGHILSALGHARLDDTNLSGRYLVIETITPPALAAVADALSPDAVFLFRNGTIVVPHQEDPDFRTEQQFSLIISEKVCIHQPIGNLQCNTTPTARMFFKDTGLNPLPSL
ncbi:MAG: hypothetical protein WCX63_01055 [Methanoregula sp.]